MTGRHRWYNMVFNYKKMRDIKKTEISEKWLPSWLSGSMIDILSTDTYMHVSISPPLGSMSVTNVGRYFFDP